MSNTSYHRSLCGIKWETLLYALQFDVSQAHKAVGSGRDHRRTNRLPCAYAQDHMYHSRSLRRHCVGRHDIRSTTTNHASRDGHRPPASLPPTLPLFTFQTRPVSLLPTLAKRILPSSSSTLPSSSPGKSTALSIATGKPRCLPLIMTAHKINLLNVCQLPQKLYMSQGTPIEIPTHP